MKLGPGCSQDSNSHSDDSAISTQWTKSLSHETEQDFFIKLTKGNPELTLGVAILRLIPRRGAAIMIEWMMLLPSPTQANVRPLSEP